MKNYVFSLILVICLPLAAVIVPWSSLSPAQQSVTIPDMAGRVSCSEEFLQSDPVGAELRVLPELAAGWPQTYTVSNCFKGAVYLNMDEDTEDELVFGVGTKIVAHNLDGSAVPGWPQQLGYYIWSSPACGDIDGDGEMEIVACSRNNTTGNEGELYAFELNGNAVAGFPVTMAGGGTMNACLADIDADEDLEILINVRNSPNGWTYIFDGDGSVYEGWPQQLDTFPGASISVGDVTGDDIPEIIGLSYESLFVWDTAGNILDGFPVSQAGYNYSYSQPILADVDDDGLREIIYGGCSGGGAVFVVNADGSNADGWPQTVGQWIFGTPALADIDDDGELDIIIGDQVSSTVPSDQLYAWHGDGTAVDGFPAGPTNAIYAQTGIADLDGDGQVEIMIDDNVFGNGYECYNHDGSHCTDWPLPCGTGWDSITMQMTPVFGDFDRDGLLEIAGAATGFTSYIVECCLWDTESNWDDELAFMPIDGCNIQHDGLYPQELAPPPPPEAPQACNAEVFEYNTIITGWLMEDAGQIGFNIYSNGELLEEITDPDARESQYPDMMEGEYSFYVTAVYTEVESDPSPAADVEIVFNSPQNLDYDLNCGVVYLYWDAPAMRGLTGYNIYRNGEFFAFTEETSYNDASVMQDTYLYYLTAVFGECGEGAPSEEIEVNVVPVAEDNIPVAALQLSNYPNPFNPETTISFILAKEQIVDVDIYNTAGKLVKSYGRIPGEKGTNQLIWNGQNNDSKLCPSGLYIIKLNTPGGNAVKRCLLLK